MPHFLIKSTDIFNNKLLKKIRSNYFGRIFRIKYYNENWEYKDEVYEDWCARVIQHETDHLDGKLFVDHLPSVRREMVMRKVKKANK
jgi:peptide deformylase